MRLLTDENFNGTILRGLIRRLPNLDVVRVQDVGLRNADDPIILEWAANENRILLTHDVIALLARSGGKRKTDNFEVFPCPEREADGNYHIHFFTHGLRHFPEAEQQHVQTLLPDTRLWLMHDLQNPFDSRALVLRTEDRHQVGYCPRYLVQDLYELVSSFPEQVKIKVERVNPSPTPLQFCLLCNLTAPWLPGFEPFSSPSYQALVESPATMGSVTC